MQKGYYRIQIVMCIFRYRIDWGDGNYEEVSQDHLVPFIEYHQYKYCDKLFYIAITYQNLGSGSNRPCGETVYGYIETTQGKSPDPPRPTCYHA